MFKRLRSLHWAAIAIAVIFVAAWIRVIYLVFV